MMSTRTVQNWYIPLVYCNGIYFTAASVRTVGGVCLRCFAGAPQAFHQAGSLRGQLIAAPHHVLIGATQHQLVAVLLRHNITRNGVQHLQRHTACLCGPHQRGNVRVGVKPQQRVAGAKRIVE